MRESFDENNTYLNAMKFMNNFSKKRNGISNVYVFTSVDKNGNVVDEKYGMNLMTRQGFSEIYANGVEFSARDTNNNTVRLYVGTGVGEVPYAVTDTDLELPAFGGLAATNSDRTKSYEYPMYFSKGENDGEGLITLISRFLVAYYDYNITNYPGEYSLTEYGIKHNNTLWTHSKIYDIHGDPASITKTSNERLNITVYMCLSFYESILMNGWSNNRFTMITRNDIMYDRMAWSARVKIYKLGDVLVDVTDGGTSRTQDTSQNNVFTNSTIAPQIILRDNNSNTYHTDTKSFDGGYIDGFVFTENGFISVEPQFLQTPENIELINFTSEDPSQYSGFADKFGKNPTTGYSKEQYPQLTHLFDVDAWLFDEKSGDWTCVLDVYNPDNRWYCETSMGNNCCLPIYYSNNGEILTGYVYQNIRPDDLIVRIISGASTIYATNKYWSSAGDQENQDPNKGWVWIRDYNNIPSACRSAKYWITNTNVDELSFERASDKFQLLVKGTNKNGYANYTEYSSKYGIASIADNYEYGWYKRGNTVYIPDLVGRSTFTIGVDDNETMTYDKWMIVFQSAVNSILLTDMSDAVNGTVEPSTVSLPFTSDVNVYLQTHRTESGTGLICIESTVSEETVVIDMRNGAFSQSVHSWKHACCIWGTNKVAYINAGTSDPNVYIFNYDTNQIEGNPISFPSGISDMPHIFGHTNYLWMTDGSTFGYMCDLRTPTVRNLDGFAYSGLYGAGLNYVKYVCVDDVFIVYKYNECGNDDIKLAHFIMLNDPANPRSMNDFSTRTTTSYIGTRIIYDLRYVNIYKTSQNITSAALSLTIMRGWSSSSSPNPGCECRVFDFGQYIHTGDMKYVEHAFDRNFGNLCFYGENIIYEYNKKIPIINYLPIKLTGKTDTITSMNHIKSITGKSWLIGYTNTPTWGDGTSNPKGIPPGIPLATTNGDGTIVGWS